MSEAGLETSVSFEKKREAQKEAQKRDDRNLSSFSVENIVKMYMT